MCDTHGTNHDTIMAQKKQNMLTKPYHGFQILMENTLDPEKNEYGILIKRRVRR